MRHIIKTQVIELSIPEGKHAFAIQHELSRYFWNEIAPQLEKAFNAISSEDEYIIIERLELDLGAITLKQLNSTSFAIMIFELLQAELAGMVVEKSKIPTRRIASHALSFCEQWLHFIEKGYLPWNSETPGKEWLPQVLEALATNYDYITTFKKILISNSSAIQRTIVQHRQDFLVKLVEVITAKKQSELLQIVPELAIIIQILETGRGIAGKVFPVSEAVLHVWTSILKASANDKRLLPFEFAEEILSHEITDPSIVTASWKQVSLKVINVLPVLRRVMREKQLRIKNAIQEKKTQEKKQSPYISEDQLEYNHFHQNDTPHEKVNITDSTEHGLQTSAKTREILQQFSLDDIPPDGIFVAHAGLVLLYPYLNTFFKLLQLVNDGKFVDHHSMVKASQLLYYIATGYTDIPEYELVIAKVLCAMPVAESVLLEAELPQDALNEADELLQVLIERWHKLKKSSVAAIREAFLQRQGKLFVAKGKLKLIIEGRGGIDELLEWKTAMIRLPWMQQFLEVEWVGQH